MVKLLYRITAFVMAVVMLFGCISCKSNNEQRDEVPEYDKNQRFELINDPPSYSEEFIERAAISFADIGERLALAVKNVKVTEAQKISFKNYFKTEIFSILVTAQIYSDEADALFYTATSMVLGGGIGNMIDRVAYGYVVDFIDFCAFPSLWKWIFNGADSFVCVGAGLLMLWFVLAEVRAAKRERAKKEEDTDGNAQT